MEEYLKRLFGKQVPAFAGVGGEDDEEMSIPGGNTAFTRLFGQPSVSNSDPNPSATRPRLAPGQPATSGGGLAPDTPQSVIDRLNTAAAEKPNWAIGKYSNQARERLPDDASPADVTRDEFDDLQSTEPKREKSFWKRLGAGLWDGAKMWAKSDDASLGGLLAAVAGGGAGMAASPSGHAEYQKNQELNKLWNRYQQQLQPEMADLQRQGQQAKIAGDILDVQNKGLDSQGKRIKNTTDMYDPLYKSITADNKVTAEEKALWEARTGMPINEYSAQKMVEKEQGGRSYIRGEFDPGYTKNVTLPDDPTEYPVKVDTAAGRQVYAKGPQVLAADATAANQEANRRQRTDEFNASKEFEAAKANVDNQQQYQNKSLDLRMKVIEQLSNVLQSNGQVQGTFQALQTANAQLQDAGQRLLAIPAEDNTGRREDAQADFDKAQKAFAELQQVFDKQVGAVQGGAEAINQIQQLAPERPATVAAPRVEAARAGKTVTQQQLANFAQSKGWDIERAKKYAADNGWTIQ